MWPRWLFTTHVQSAVGSYDYPIEPFSFELAQSPPKGLGALTQPPCTCMQWFKIKALSELSKICDKLEKHKFLIMSNKCGDGVVGGKGGGGIQQPSGQTNRVPPLSNPGTTSWFALFEFQSFETNLFIRTWHYRHVTTELKNQIYV